MKGLFSLLLTAAARETQRSPGVCPAASRSGG
jgi:hypothetical protein